MKTYTNEMCETQDAILALEDRISHQPTSDPWAQSALVCCSDAWDLYDAGNFVAAARRAAKGMSYVAGFHANDWRTM